MADRDNPTLAPLQQEAQRAGLLDRRAERDNGDHQASFAGGLLHYRPWQGTLLVPDGYGTVWFLAVQASLLVLIACLGQRTEEPAAADPPPIQGIGGALNNPTHRPPPPLAERENTNDRQTSKRSEPAPIDPVSSSAITSWRPTVRLLLSLVFVGMWGFVVRSRAWPIARVSLAMIFRRKLFWGLYVLALLVFLGFFFGQYLMSWASTQLGEQTVRVGGLGRANPKWLIGFLRDFLKLNGSAETFRNFMNAEAYTVMIVLVLAGSVLIGNDLRFGSMPFFLSKPISRWDYLLGKGLAVAVFLNLFTTLPAVALFVEYGLLESWDYFQEYAHLLVGILGYGLVLTISCTLLLLAMATWLRRTVPLIMTWTALFSFCRILANALVDGLHQDRRWRLIDVWNSAGLLGNSFLGIPAERVTPQPQPTVQAAALVLSAVSIACLTFLIMRIRAVEIVK